MEAKGRWRRKRGTAEGDGVWGGGLKGSALIRDREGVSGQTDTATWKPAVHTPAAS